MDTSETYIKMCDCKEIQSLMPKITGSPYDYEIKEGELGSLYWMNDGIEILHYDNDTGLAMIGSYGEEDDEKIWLPTQSQLQKMVDVDFRLVIHGIAHVLQPDVSKYINIAPHLLGQPPTYWRNFDSMEQLLLAFVQKTNHGKVWNGTDWVKDGIRLIWMQSRRWLEW